MQLCIGGKNYNSYHNSLFKCSVTGMTRTSVVQLNYSIYIDKMPFAAIFPAN